MRWRFGASASLILCVIGCTPHSNTGPDVVSAPSPALPKKQPPAPRNDKKPTAIDGVWRPDLKSLKVDMGKRWDTPAHRKEWPSTLKGIQLSLASVRVIFESGSYKSQIAGSTDSEQGTYRISGNTISLLRDSTSRGTMWKLTLSPDKKRIHEHAESAEQTIDFDLVRAQ